MNTDQNCKYRKIRLLAFGLAVCGGLIIPPAGALALVHQWMSSWPDPTSFALPDGDGRVSSELLEDAYSLLSLTQENTWRVYWMASLCGFLLGIGCSLMGWCSWMCCRKGTSGHDSKSSKTL